MREFLLITADLLLALGACLRLTRLVVTDDIPGQWWIKDPLDSWMHKKPGNTLRLRFHRYATGLECLFCTSVWAAAAAIITLMIAGGPGDAATWWRIAAGILSLAWITAHIGMRAGDAGYSDEE